MKTALYENDVSGLAMMNLKILQDRIGYTFREPDLLRLAVTHRSYSSHHNERLEFLGDSLLNCVTAINLYGRFASLNEGSLSRLRSSLVRQQALHEVAQKLDLSSFLQLGEGELKTGGFKRPSILADAMEALFGAIFLDSDFDTVRQVITRLFADMMKELDPETYGKDAKTQLQEYLQGHKMALPEYHVVATRGAAHNQEFEVECVIGKFDIHVYGTGSSRRAGEQEAARKALAEVTDAMKGRRTGASEKQKRMKTIGVSASRQETSAD